VNQIGWARAAVHVPAFRPAAARFLTGYAVVAAVILTSFAATGPTRVALFALAVVLDIATPYFNIAQQAVLPKLSTSKFPERFGLFTMIVLGESVVGVINGLAGLQDRGLLDAPAIGAGVLGLAIGFALWWIYFDFVARRAPKPVLVMALFWVYLHAAALTGIIATGVGVSVAIADTATGPLTAPSRYLVVGGVALAVVGIAALETTLARGEDEPTHPRLSPAIKIGAGLIIAVLGLLDLGWSTHALLALLLAGLAVPMAYGAIVWLRPITTLPTAEPEQ
jgi:low temperature requirement protein LtrA